MPAGSGSTRRQTVKGAGKTLEKGKRKENKMEHTYDIMIEDAGFVAAEPKGGEKC